MLRSWTTVLVAACALLGAGPAVAAAAQREVRVLPEAPGLPALVFGTSDGDFCVGLDGDDPSDLDACGDPSRRDDDAVVVDGLALPDGVLAGMVPAGAAAVRIAFADGARVVAPVSLAPAGLGPVAARLGFFRIRTPVGAGTRAVWGEVLDAAGAVRGVGVLDDEGDGSRTEGRRRVLARRGGRPIYGDARVEQALEPTVARLDRVVERACVELGPDLGGLPGDGDPTSTSCSIGIGPGTLIDADVVPTTGCRPDFAGVHGVLPVGATGATAVLGDGRRVALRTSSLAPVAPGRLAIAYVPPAGEALRSVDLRPGGRHVPLGLAPASVACAGANYSGTESLYIDVRDGPPASAAHLLGTLRVLRATAAGTLLGAEAADGSLCVAVDRTRVSSEDCAPLGRAPGSVVVTRARPRDGRAVVAGVTGPRVAAVRLQLTGVPGRHRSRQLDVPTVPAASDAGGDYAGRLRAFVISLPGDELPFLPIGLAASGRELPTGPEVADALPLPVLGDGSGAPRTAVARLRTRRLGRTHGLRAWRVEPGDGSRCGAVTTGGRPTLLELECREPRLGPAGTVQARCSSTGLTVVAVLRGRRSRLRATTGAGTERVAVRFALGHGDVLHVVTLGRRSSLRSLAATGTGSDARPAAAAVPPARAQCGYTSGVQLVDR